MKINVVFASVFGVLLAGCGGSNQSASPFTGTTADGRDAAAGSKSVSRSTSGARAIPVYLTVTPEQVTSDLWISVNGGQVQTASASQNLDLANTGQRLRLASLRDVEGRRFLFLGMAKSNDRLVRASIQLSDTYFQSEVGEKSTTHAFAASKTDGSGSVTLTVPLEPNAEFRDGLVLELQLNNKDDKFTPALVIGKATDIGDPMRQERGLFESKVASISGKTPDQTIHFSGWQGAISTDSKISNTEKELTKGQTASGTYFFDPSTQQTGLANLQIGTVTSQKWIRGKLAAWDADANKCIVEMSATSLRDYLPSTQSFSCSKDAKPPIEGTANNQPILATYDEKSKLLTAIWLEKPVKLTLQAPATAPTPTKKVTKTANPKK